MFTGTPGRVAADAASASLTRGGRTGPGVWEVGKEEARGGVFSDTPFLAGLCQCVYPERKTGRGSLQEKLWAQVNLCPQRSCRAREAQELGAASLGSEAICSHLLAGDLRLFGLCASVFTSVSWGKLPIFLGALSSEGNGSQCIRC